MAVNRYPIFDDFMHTLFLEFLNLGTVLKKHAKILNVGGSFSDRTIMFEANQSASYLVFCNRMGWAIVWVTGITFNLQIGLQASSNLIASPVLSISI